MLAKEIKIPMIVGVALYGFAFFLILIITIGQRVFCKAFTPSQITETVIPVTLFVNLLILIMFAVFLFVMKTNKDDNRRTVGIIMFIFFSVFRLISVFAGMLEKQIYARYGQESLVAVSSVESVISIAASPFLFVATVLVVIAIARYGISDSNSNFKI